MSYLYSLSFKDLKNSEKKNPHTSRPQHSRRADAHLVDKKNITIESKMRHFVNA